MKMSWRIKVTYELKCVINFFSFQVRAARNLLSAVTRLLILADMIDVHLLLKKLKTVEDDLENVIISNDTSHYTFKNLSLHLVHVLYKNTNIIEYQNYANYFCSTGRVYLPINLQI